ncbi:MAG: sigma 54-interacting transcriptional regulator [Desulfobacteraceae bacterium]|nr:sigma 54-interacting transcriptional regulator [Desulfobacteraceae bacterium]
MSDNQKNHVWDSRFAGLLVDAMGEGVFTLDSQGRITSWNRAMERISGYRAEEAIGRPCSILKFTRCFGRECPADITECQIYKKGVVAPSECQLQHKNGHQISVIKNARVLKDDNGTVIGVVETLTDLTELTAAKRKAEEAEQKLLEKHQFRNIIGKSHAMREVFQAIRVAAKSEASVLLQGESGTGKELVAGAIHYNSERSKGPLVTVNCSALSESLLESELFGHVRGAFTGAHRDRVGRFEEAHGGTILLDEIGDVSPLIQLKLLRVLQEHQIERVGDTTPRYIDLRVIAATHTDLYSLVREGLFREDLFYRLKVFPVSLPPLRERREDIPLLVRHFVDNFNRKTGKSISGLSHDALRLLMDYRWPGNVRELENAIEHAFVLCETQWIDVFDLPVEIRQMELSPWTGTSSAEPAAAADRKKLDRESLMALLHECGWNKAEVGRRLGKSRTSVWKYMKQYGIPLEPPGEL